MDIKKRLGNRAFYRMVLTIAVPMMIQNGVSNLVSLLDNLMIGCLGTNELSGVAIANQLAFVFYLLIFGTTAGVGIFTAQYYGKGDTEGVRWTFQFKLIANTFMSLLSIGIFLLFTPALISLFLKGEGSVADPEAILKTGTEYMMIMLFGLIPVGLTNAYSGTLRDTGNTSIPMIASVIAIFVNLLGNFVLIFGYLGCPAMGARGAAIATVISRFVELGFLVIYTGTHSAKHAFIIGAFSHFRIPGKLIGQFIIRSLPLMANETLWSLGNVVINQSYSYRSLTAVPATSISSTIWGLVAVSFLAMGEAVGIIVGPQLGNGEIEKARDSAIKIRDFTVFCGIICAVVLGIISPFFPLFYNTSEPVRRLASGIIFLNALAMPLVAYMHASYFIIRSGGNTFITFLFDSCFALVISVPLAYVLSRYTNLSVLWMLAIVQSGEIIKCIIGGVMVKSGIWARNIVRT